MAIFMYGYKSKHKPLLKWIFTALRFITFFCILLLLINPKLKSKSYILVKPKLPVMVDNSSSIKQLNENINVNKLVKRFQENKGLNKLFDISYFTFGNDFKKLDSLSFDEKNTNISKALSSVEALFENEIAPVVLITDGNQTYGSDYEFASSKLENQIFPLVVGDSTTYTDLRIERVNANRYAFLRNEFPVEILMVYDGNQTVNSRFEIKQGTTAIFNQNISFSKKERSKTLNINLPANNVGLQKYSAEIISLKGEKNKNNNKILFAVEVIDQATNVLVVSEILHPDLGALKKSITSNRQRSLEIKNPKEALPLLNDYQLIVLYQPNSKFDDVFKEISKLKKNTLTITGTQTDWNFLNAAQNKFSKNAIPQNEDVGGELNKNFNPFIVEDLGFQDFRPLKSSFGELTIPAPHETLLEQRISGFNTGNPLLATIEVNGERSAIWDAENIWKWRAQSFLRTRSFEQFDRFIGNLVQFLASNKKRTRLEVLNEPFYYTNLPIKITAQYFDKNFVFDDRASISISVENNATKASISVPMLLKNNFYEADLSNLDAGNYNFKVNVAEDNISKSGSFSLIEYNVEQQFLNANYKKLETLAKNTDGKAYFISDVDALIDKLRNDERFKTVQKSETKTVPLIDWQYLLIIIAICLASEWFTRKYNGLI